ncbi:LysM peptidoglycan-binding domain-containing protein [Virgibacillus sp. MSP4-1]|uniref:LysM peptidoglycan-binding domain-containing protein n=1 Tax=Virgibacillus sp. MSP4-1 TaxID=2700081 RepID=UPI00039B7F02|nr:LysM domain-containing protein [Virgibacillus sp. MSP4-1]QHS22775.1 LysM peptidoglycan-binding domain-containing protein [Virgibacillus sp. MSP4-1]
MKLLKKLILIIIVLLFVRSIIHDITAGTATESQFQENPAAEMNNNEDTPADVPVDREITQENESEYKPVTHTVQPGDTVLSISENLNKDPVEIQKLLKDFQTLNPEVNPNEIQIGETYFFPKYRNE